MENNWLQALLLGISIMMAIFIAINIAYKGQDQSKQRVFALFSAAIGLAITYFLAQNPLFMEKYLLKVNWTGVALVLALLWFFRSKLK